MDFVDHDHLGHGALSVVLSGWNVRARATLTDAEHGKCVTNGFEKQVTFGGGE
jgi:hypothetical protein